MGLQLEEQRDALPAQGGPDSLHLRAVVTTAGMKGRS